MKQYIDISSELARYFAGEMNESEKKNFIRMIERNEKMKKEFEIMKKTWGNINPEALDKFSDTDSAWTKLRDRLDNDGLILKDHEKTRLISPVFYRIAASILLFLAISTSAWLLLSDRIILFPEKITYSADKNTSSYDLPDGSRVLLKKGSDVKISRNFKTQRSVRLEGEAFFDIMKDPSHPFSIETRNASITVLGTSFNIKENNDNGITEVLVESGKVSVRPLKNKDELVMNPGQYARISPEDIQLMELKDPNYLAWKTREFQFLNQRLEHVFNILEDAYQVNIEVSGDEINSLRLTSSYSKQSIDAIMQTIGTAFNLEIEENQNTYRVVN